MQKAAADTGFAREYKSVFDLQGVPAFQQFYDFGVFIWKWLWKGFYKPWHVIHAPTIASPEATRNMYGMNAAKARANTDMMAMAEPRAIKTMLKTLEMVVDMLKAATTSSPLRE